MASGKPNTQRTGGILLHLTSLPSPYGIGTLGEEAFRFVDFLRQAGLTYWQILPVGPTDENGHSPYQSDSTFAGNPALIDLTLLAEDGLLKTEELEACDWGSDPKRVDFDKLHENRTAILRKAFARFDRESSPFRRFIRAGKGWLADYALFRALKREFDGAPWMDWEPALRLREEKTLRQYRRTLRDEILFEEFVQYEFFRQWRALKRYAEKKMIRFIGDIPIYVALDSADVWANQSLFQLDENGTPTDVSGCPPDAFSATGQLWGNPLYRWEAHKADGYRWWMERIRAASARFDRIRIDHFRGLEAYYAIPYGDPTAENGRWRKGPGYDFFKVMKQTLGDVDLIAEDLGFLTESVHRLLRRTGYPGMKVLQFAFSTAEESSYLPHRHIPNCVVYTGTHDNDTLESWFSSLSEADAAFCTAYLHLTEEEGIQDGLLRAAWSSVADTAIAPMQDFLPPEQTARMNTPSTVGGNWEWRMPSGALTPELARKIRELTKRYGRLSHR